MNSQPIRLRSESPIQRRYSLEPLEQRLVLTMPAFDWHLGSSDPFNDLNVQDASFADLDGDGDLDMVAAGTGTSGTTPRYFPNVGTTQNPSFVEETTNNPFSSMDRTTVVIFADLDQDGDTDLFNSAGEFFRNEGDAQNPNFQPWTVTIEQNDPAQFYINPTFADLDADGLVDIVVAFPFRYFRNTGTAQSPAFNEQIGNANPFERTQDSVFAHRDFSSQFNSPTFGDLDLDGDLDMLYGRPDGNFAFSENVGTRQNALFIDVEVDDVPSPRDPFSDLIFNSSDQFNDLNPTFVDLDLDGDQDVVAGDRSGRLRFFENTGIYFGPAFSAPLGAANPFLGLGSDGPSFRSSPTFGDVDMDGDLDLVSGNSSGTFRYYENIGTNNIPHLEERLGPDNPFNFSSFTGSNWMPALGDLDGDGDVDLVADSDSGALGVFENLGNGVFQRISAGSNLNGTPTLGDLDGDGDLDLLTSWVGTLHYFENDGSIDGIHFTESPSPFDGIVVRTAQGIASEQHPALGDLDRDGDVDLLLADYTGKIRYFENIGAATTPQYAEKIGPRRPLGGFARADSITTADVNGDGWLDVVAGDGSDFRLFSNDGVFFQTSFGELTGGFNPVEDVTYFSFGGASPTFADIDNDGDTDLAVAHHLSNEIRFFENTGDADSASFVNRTYSFTELPGNNLAPENPSFGDLDNDGDMDLLTSIGGSGGVRYYENTGTANAPSFTQLADDDPNNPFDELPDLSWPVLVDLDDDGKQDLVGVSETDPPLRFFKNTGTAESPIFSEQTGFFAGISHPTDSPSFGDVDRDGDLDMLLSVSSVFRYIENVGTPSTPLFREQLSVSNPVFDFRDSPFTSESNAVLVDLDGDENIEIVLAEQTQFQGDTPLRFFERSFARPANIYDFSAASYTVPEGNTTSTANLVRLNRAESTTNEYVDVFLSAGVTNPATAGSDFIGGFVTVHFDVGEASKFVPVQLLGDNAVEVDETMELSLARFSENGRRGSTNSTAVLTIVNDDTLITDDNTSELRMVEEGGSFPLDEVNLAIAGKAFSSPVLVDGNGNDFAAHQTIHLNDGQYGNAHSWIGRDIESFAGIGLGATPVPISSLAFGRSNVSSGDPCGGGVCTDRSLGQYVFEFTTTPNPDLDPLNAEWTRFGEIEYTQDDPPQPHLRHRFDFDPIMATGIRLKITSPPSFNEVAIDEIELYSAPLEEVTSVIYDFASPSFSVSEGNSNNPSDVVMLNRSDSGAAEIVLVGLSDGTADAGTDYVAGPITIGFDVGESSKAVPISILGESTVEMDETVELSLSGFTSGGRSGSTNPTAILTISNDDSAVVSIDNPTTSEGGPLTFSLNISNPVDVAITADRSTQDGTATTADNDFAMLADSGVTLFSAGSTAASLVPISTASDNKVELDESIQLVLSALNAGGRSVSFIGAGNTLIGTGTIENDDNAVININAPTATEGSDLGFSVSISNPVDVEITADRATQDDSATTADGDYSELVSSNTSLFAAGSTTPLPILVNTITDDLMESDEMVNLVLSNLSASGRDVTFNGGGGSLVGTGTITDVQFTRYDFSSATFFATEGNATVGTSVVILGRSDGTLAESVDIVLTGETAVAGMDFVSGPITVSFGVGETSKSVPIELLGENRVELDETINLSLANFSAGGQLGTLNPTATLTIVNDDNAVISITSPSVTEGNSLEFSVTIDRPVDVAITAERVTQENSATTANNDFSPLSSATSTLFAANSTTPFSIVVNTTSDDAFEADETLSLVLSALSSGGRDVVFSGSQTTLVGIGTIENDDSEAIPFSMVEQGGAFDDNNLAFGGTPFAKDVIVDNNGNEFSSHKTAHLNDQTYGNSNSWIGGSANSYAGISLGAVNVEIKSLAFGRSNVLNGDPCPAGVCTDRSLGVYTFEYTTTPNPHTSPEAAEWIEFGEQRYEDEPSKPHLRHRFNFESIMATGVRIVTPSGAAIDEIELYATHFSGPEFISGGTSLQFDGVNDYVKSAGTLNVSEGTWEAWVRKDDWGDRNDERLLGNGIDFANANSFYVSLHHDVGLHFRYGDVQVGAAAFESDATKRDLSAGWHHLAATWKHEFGLTALNLFVDGQPYASASANLLLDAAANDMYFGASPGLPAFGGVMDEVRVWNIARSQEQIAETMNATLVDDQIDLATYFRFDVENGSIAQDVVNVESGALFGEPTYVDSSAAVFDRGFAIHGTDNDDYIRIWWNIDHDHRDDVTCAFESPGCEHLDFLNVTINGEEFETEYTPQNNSETIFVFGGPGNDRIVMTPESAQHWNAQFHGEEGDDTLIGAEHRYGSDRGGKDRLFGGPGNDILQGGEGNDQLNGGPGIDQIRPFDDVDITGTTTQLLVQIDESDLYSRGINVWRFEGIQEIDGESYDVFYRESTGRTYFGDANGDGVFDSADLVQVFKYGEFEDNISGNSTWAEGDFNADGDFDRADLQLALELGRYEGSLESHNSGFEGSEHDHGHHEVETIDGIENHQPIPDHDSHEEAEEPVHHEHEHHQEEQHEEPDLLVRDALFAEPVGLIPDDHHDDEIIEETIAHDLSHEALIP